MFISSDGGNTWRQVTERLGDREEIFRANSANISLIFGILRLIVTFCLLKKKKLKQQFCLVSVAGRIDGQWGKMGRAGQGIRRTGVSLVCSFFHSTIGMKQLPDANSHSCVR